DAQAGGSSDRLRLSDYRFDVPGSPDAAPPRGGFVRIVSPASYSEGKDQDGLLSYQATNHQLHFTTILPGGTDQNQYSATVAGVTYTSRAAEIAYFLYPDTGRFTNGPGTVQLYKLIRRQRLVAVTPSDQAT